MDSDYCEYKIDGNCCLSISGKIEKCYFSGRECSLRKKFNEQLQIKTGYSLEKELYKNV